MKVKYKGPLAECVVMRVGVFKRGQVREVPADVGLNLIASGSFTEIPVLKKVPKRKPKREIPRKPRTTKPKEEPKAEVIIEPKPEAEEGPEPEVEIQPESQPEVIPEDEPTIEDEPLIEVPTWGVKDLKKDTEDNKED